MGLLKLIIRALIFEQSLRSSRLPSEWNNENMVPAHTSGNIYSGNKYCNYSLRSIFSKLLDSILYYHLHEFLVTKLFLISPCMASERCSLWEHYHFFIKYLFSKAGIGGDTYSIHVDFSKAFEIVSKYFVLLVLSDLYTNDNVG